MEDISGKVAVVATSVNEVLQQLSSLTQVVCDMHGCVYGGSGGVDERGTITPGDSLSSVGSITASETSLASENFKLGGDFVTFN